MSQKLSSDRFNIAHMPDTVSDAYHVGRSFLRAKMKQNKYITPDMDARILLGNVLDFDYRNLLLNPDILLIETQKQQFVSMLKRRIKGEPVARIIQSAEFYGLEFSLNEACLIPRPESELLVDKAIRLCHANPHWQNNAHPSFLDIATGSGAILLAVLAQCENICGIGCDISEQAVHMANNNAQRHELKQRACFFCGDYLDGLSGKFSLITANPPYIKRANIAKLQPEVRLHDPIQALDGGNDGLQAYERLIPHAYDKLSPGGVFLLEIGFNQARQVGGILRKSGFKNIVCHKDLQGHDRCLQAESPV